MSRIGPATTTDVIAPAGKFSRTISPLFVPVAVTAGPDRENAVLPRICTFVQFAKDTRFRPPRDVLLAIKPSEQEVNSRVAMNCPANALPSTMKSEVENKATWTPASVVVASPKLFPVTATRLQLARETLGLYEDVFLEPMSDP